jgi:pilus assembly protein TadC
MNPATAAIFAGLAVMSIVYGLRTRREETTLSVFDAFDDEATTAYSPPVGAPVVVQILLRASWRLQQVPFFRSILKLGENSLSTNERLLAQAGRPFGLRAVDLQVLTTVGVVAFGAAGVLFGLLTHISWFITGIIGVIIPLYPRAMVSQRAKRRSREIRRSMPAMLDLLIMTAEAGMTPEAGVVFVAQQMHGALGDEMRIAAQQIRSGMTTEDAFMELAARTQIEEVEIFVQALNTAIRFSRLTWTEVLKAQAERLRIDLRQELESAVRKLTVRIVVPLVAFFLPSILILTIGPSLQGLHGTI